jgi:hypothetical protein
MGPDLTLIGSLNLNMVLEKILKLLEQHRPPLLGAANSSTFMVKNAFLKLESGTFV